MDIEINGYFFKRNGKDDYKCLQCKSRYNSKSKHRTPHEAKCRNKKNREQHEKFAEKNESPNVPNLFFPITLENFQLGAKTKLKEESTDNLVLTCKINEIRCELKDVNEERKKLEKEYEKLSETIKSRYLVREIDMKKAKKIYDVKFRNPNGMIKKIKDKEGKNIAIFDGKKIASVISYVTWNLDGIIFVEVVMLATASEYERRGFAKFLLISLMLDHKVATWAEYNALDFYKSLGFREEAKLGWDLSDEISYATHSVFCMCGFTEKEIEKLCVKI